MTCCAVEMDGDVYVSGRSQSTHFINVLHYSQANNSWSILNHLPCTHSSLAIVRSKSQLIAVGGIYVEIGDDDDLEGDIPTKVLGKVLTWDVQMDCWVNAYLDMPTARCSSTAVGHSSTVIVAGGVTGWEPTATSTSVVEVMTVNEIPLRSEWTAVQSLPYPSSFAPPMIIGDQLYIASGYSGDKMTCGILTAAVPNLVTSKKDDTIFVWEKISDLPHDSLSIGECDGRLVVFGGRRKSGMLEDGQLQYKVVSPIHLYNEDTDTWDYVGHVPKEYCYWLECTVTLKQNKLLLVGGAIDPNETSHNVYLSTCVQLTITK